MHENVTTYESLGVRRLINCRGTLTIISGSLILPEVKAARMEAATGYVQLEELMEKVGARLAELMQCEFGLVTNGCAAAICQVTSACMTGDDAEKRARLPDTSGMKNEVLLLKSHQHGYNHAIRMTGARMIEVETAEEFEAAIGPQTAMISVFGDVGDRGALSVAQMVEIGKREGVPVFVDAAAERPDVPNRYLADGVDAVAYSGGKCMRGPQSSGLVLGRRDLLWQAFMHGAPHAGIGRPMKAGKEEIMGMLAAVEAWVRRDHDAEWKTWEQRLETIWEAVRDIPTMTRQIHQPGRSNVAPVLQMGWDADALGLTPDAVLKALSEGTPRVEASAHATGVQFVPYMMEEGEADLLAQRLREIFDQAE